MAERPPRNYDQLDPSTDPNAAGRRNDCGESATATLCSAGDLPDTPPDVIRALGHDGVTDGQELFGYLAHRGAQVTPVPDWPDILHAVQKGDAYALILIHDNNNAEPDANGPNMHWICPYGIDPQGRGVQCTNSWPDSTGRARYADYNPNVLASAFVEGAVIRWPAVQTSGSRPTGGVARSQGVSSMGATICPPGQQCRFFGKPDGTLHEVYFNEHDLSWHGPVAVPGVTNVAGDLSASINDTGSQVVQWSAADGSQWEAWYDTKWNGPLRLPGT